MSPSEHRDVSGKTVSGEAVRGDTPNQDAESELVVPPPSASVDELIRWHTQFRSKTPALPLGQFIQATSLALPSLVELVCVDLIGLRRRDHDVTVETYLEQFPPIALVDEHMLDLIDAEICVRNEMGDQQTLQAYEKRFPKLSSTIKQLMFLDARNATPELPPEDRFAVLNTADALQQGFQIQDADSVEFSLQREMTIHHGASKRLPQDPDSQDHDDSIDVVIPIQPPDWMTGARCIATSVMEFGRCWLIKGRDTQRGDTVAMKVLPIPNTIGRQTRTRMLDLCENSSSVTHDAWIAPRIAAINNGHLAVVRPWVFGRPLERHSNALSELAHLPRIAFALSAAHRIGATHGAVIERNLIIDHEGQIRLIDATSGANGWIETWKCWNNDLEKSLPVRIQIDSVGLVHLIAMKCALPDPESRIDWLEQLTQGVSLNHPDACATLGENLQALLDVGPRKKKWWSPG